MYNQITAYIALGANLGNPLQQLDLASQSLGAHDSITRVAMSPVYKSVPHGDVPQPDYYNAVMSVETTLSPQDLLAFMHMIEQENGRERKVRWGARTLDLDLIIYGNVVLDDAGLQVPHPRAHEREFVVKPLYDLKSDLVIPNYGAVRDLLEGLPLNNLTEVRRGTTYHY